MLGRDADADGLKWWADQIESRSMTPRQASLGFLGSPEYKDRAEAAFQSGDLMSLVNDLYPALLGRQSDPGGAEYWRSVLAKFADNPRDAPAAAAEILMTTLEYKRVAEDLD
ncbi:MAG: DUF4214 domain-containing protein [Deltaproteobacteria bacterium]|nr:DUF4214 domain-containing protein [Deltaproteobacteria bacterium]